MSTMSDDSNQTTITTNNPSLQQQKQQQQTYALMKIPDVLYTQWQHHYDSKRTECEILNKPMENVCLGEIEKVEYLDGSIAEYFVWVDPTNNKEERFLLRELNTPQDPFMMFQYLPPHVEQIQQSHNDQQQPLLSSVQQIQVPGRYELRAKLTDFRDISIPFEVHQLLVKHQQDLNNQLRQQNQLQQFDGHKALETQMEQREQAHIELLQHNKQVTAENKSKTKRYRATEEEVVTMLFSLFEQRPHYTLDELVEFTDQPRKSLAEDILPKYYDKITSGELRGKWKIKK